MNDILAFLTVFFISFKSSFSKPGLQYAKNLKFD